MINVEIDMVVSDSLKALELYKDIFDANPVEVTSFPKGENEVVFTIGDTRFHMLDENPKFHLIAPKVDGPKTVWFNVTVPNIKEVYEKAITLGCVEIQPLTEMMDYGVSNAIFVDTFGHMWMLHQIHREVSFEERVKLWEDKRE